MDEDIALEILNKHFGDLIERIIEKFEYYIDLDEEYEELLEYIYLRIIRIWFKGKQPTITEFERKLREAKKHKIKLIILLSYLISRYEKKRSIATLLSKRK